MPERSQQPRPITGRKRAHYEAETDETRLNAQSVLVIAQSISHLPAVTESAAQALIPDAEFRIRQIIQDAKKFMSHSKRKFLSTSDIDFALRVRNADPVYGFGPLNPTYQEPLTSLPTRTNITSSPQQSQRLTSAQPNPTSSPGQALAQIGPSNNNNAALPNNDARTPTKDGLVAREGESLQVHGDALPGSIQVVPVRPSDMPGFAQYVQASGIADLFFSRDVEHNLQEVLQAPLPPVPLEVVVNAHWLAIDSVQPKIPQNPVASEHGETREDDMRSTKRRKTRASKRISFDEEAIKTGKVATIIKPPIKHVLSRELQIYFDYVLHALFSYDGRTIQTTLGSIASEHGIMQLIPYFATFIAKTVQNHLHDLPLLLSLMRMVWAMNENTLLSIDKYLHQLLPAILTCIVGRRLCESKRHNHWALRDYAAELIKKICQRFEKSYAEMKQRMAVTLCDAFQTGRTLTQFYGGIVGLAALGPLVVKRMLIPNLKFGAKVQEALESNQLKPVQRFEAAKVYCALAAVVYNARRQTAGAHAQDEQTDRVTSVPPEEVSDVLPGAKGLLPVLEAEFGEKVYPLGEAVHGEDVINDILNLVDKDAAKKSATG